MQKISQCIKKFTNCKYFLFFQIRQAIYFIRNWNKCCDKTCSCSTIGRSSTIASSRTSSFINQSISFIEIPTMGYKSFGCTCSSGNFITSSTLESGTRKGRVKFKWVYFLFTVINYFNIEIISKDKYQNFTGFAHIFFYLFTLLFTTFFTI